MTKIYEKSIDLEIIKKFTDLKQDQIPSLIKALQICTENSIFVEIGTWQGGFAEALLKHTKCKKLYCIDPYRHFENNEYPDSMNNLTQANFDVIFANTQARLSKYGNRVEFIRELSVDAAQKFSDETFDFIYIDGNHDFAYVDADIKAWFPKLKKGGYLCGDDVYSHTLDNHDSNGNLLKVWSYNHDGLPLSWGKYGTYTACIKNETELGIKFEFEETQFSCLK